MIPHDHVFFIPYSKILSICFSLDCLWQSSLKMGFVLFPLLSSKRNPFGHIKFCVIVLNMFTIHLTNGSVICFPVSKHHYSGRQEDEFHVPYKITKLFHGGKFDKHYNKKYLSLTFKVQPETVQVKLVAIITGHGSDDNGCAEFCVTSHHFVINGFSNIKVFKNAATSMGCANRVADGVVPNEHGTWLYGRDGWCCGKDVVPWVVDVSKQVHFEEENKIRYFGWFNGTDPNPARDPGEIIMHSYLVFYKSVE